MSTVQTAQLQNAELSSYFNHLFIKEKTPSKKGEPICALIHETDTSRKVILAIIGQGLVEKEVLNTVQFAKEYFRLMRSDVRGKKINRRDFEDFIVRSFQLHPKNSYMLFNRKGDPILGIGKWKVAKTALDLVLGDLITRISVKFKKDDTKRRDKTNAEYDLSVSLGKQEGIVYTFPDSKIEYIGKTGLFTIAFLQKLYNAGNLQTLIQESLPRLSLHEKNLITRRLLGGLVCLHTVKNLIHRDIKPANIYLSRNDDGEITDAVIGDFGLASLKNDHKAITIIKGTLYYTAPELYRVLIANASDSEGLAAGYALVTTQMNDVWSMGLILFLLYQAQIPEWNEFTIPWFCIRKSDECVMMIATLQEDWIPKPIGSPIGSIIYQMLRPNPNERSSSADSLKAFLSCLMTT